MNYLLYPLRCADGSMTAVEDAHCVGATVGSSSRAFVRTAAERAAVEALS